MRCIQKAGTLDVQLRHGPNFANVAVVTFAGDLGTDALEFDALSPAIRPAGKYSLLEPASIRRRKLRLPLPW